MFEQIRKSVVTGASGFIGSALVHRLKQMGVETISIGRNFDLCQKDILTPLLDPETIVFHLAAHASIKDSVENPQLNFESNFLASFEVLESVRKVGCRMIFPSTGSVFDPDNPLPLSEKSFMRPSSPYGAAKLAMENFCISYHRTYGIDARIARFFSIYGMGMKRFAIFDLFEKIQKNSKEISILGDGKQVRDYLYLEDAIEGLLLIALKGSPGEDYNVASGQPTRIDELALLIASLMDYPDIRLKFTGKTQAGEVPQFYADISKIRKIGFSPAIPLQEGLRLTLQSFKSDSSNHESGKN